MTDLHQLLLERRSIRRYTSEPLSADDVKLILEAALLSPTSKIPAHGSLWLLTTRQCWSVLPDASLPGPCLSRVVPWLLWCVATVLSLIRGWRIALSRLLTCSFRLPTSAWALAGFRFADGSLPMAFQVKSTCSSFGYPRNSVSALHHDFRSQGRGSQTR